LEELKKEENKQASEEKIEKDEQNINKRDENIIEARKKKISKNV